MTKPTIYLAGPMTGLTIEQAQAWRLEVAEALQDTWEIRDPCRAKDHLKNTGKALTATCEFGRALFARDQYDIRHSDVVLFNFEPGGVQPDRVSIGSIFEKSWAYDWDKLTVTIMTPGNIHDHLYVGETSPVLVPNLEEAIDYIRTL